MKYVSMALMLATSLFFQGCAHHARMHDSYSHPVIVHHEITPPLKHEVRTERHVPKLHVQPERSSYRPHVHKYEPKKVKHIEGNKPHRYETSLRRVQGENGSKNFARLPHRG